MPKSFLTYRRFIAAVASITAVFAAACATSGQSSSSDVPDGKEYYASYRLGEPKVTQHFDVAVDETWKAIASAFKDLNYAGGPAENRSERLYMTPTMQLRGRLYDGELNSSYFECGRTPEGTLAAEDYELSFAVLVWADADKPSGSSVRILVNGWGHNRTNPGAVVHCTGTGRLENMFLEAIQRRLSLAHHDAQR